MPTPFDTTTEKHHYDDAVLPETTETQRIFSNHAATVQRLRQRFAEALKDMAPGELLALHSLVNEQLEATPTRQLIDSTTGTTDDNTLTLGEVSRIAEENHRRFYNFQCRLAMLLAGWFETVEARSATLAHKGDAPLKNTR